MHLETFELVDGIPRWRFAIGDVVLEREVAMLKGRSAVAVVHRLERSPVSVRLELEALCTRRDVHGERYGYGTPAVERVLGGFEFEGAYRVSGHGFRPAGEWYRGVRYRVEAERFLNDVEDLWHAGSFVTELRPGESAEVVAWAGALDEEPPPGLEIVAAAHIRDRALAAAASTGDQTDRTLLLAADQFVIAGPSVVAGYPWFGEWSRDTMTSYEGLFLETGRQEEGRKLLLRAAGSLSEGMLPTPRTRERSSTTRRTRLVPAGGGPARAADWRFGPCGGACAGPA